MKSLKDNMRDLIKQYNPKVNTVNMTNFKYQGLNLINEFGESEYFSYKKGNGYEICLEPCLKGYDIALYDNKKNLRSPKICTNFLFRQDFETELKIACNIANENFILD